MIDRATVDKILDAVRIEEVIGDFVSLRKRGANYLGLCPFHQDKNPSMSVSSTKGIFKCFACGKAGNAVTFLMEHEHLTYVEALRYLAKKYHIEIVEKEETAEEIAHRMRYESLLVVTDYAQKFYSDILWNTEIGKAVGLSYFHERKFTDETIRQFGLGYASSRPLTLCSKAIRDGYKPEYLVAAGLCLEREGTGELYDRFFDRVIFPIHSISGRVIAFGGRTLKTDKSVAKYVNSPQSEIYDKSRSLYGIFQAKNAIAKNDKCILVEGYADVISMHQAGVTNVVASSGTSLTVEQIRLIKRFTDKITIIYDGDAAGIKAALRGIDLVLEEGLNVKVVLLPPEDDPDSFAKAHNLIERHDEGVGAGHDKRGAPRAKAQAERRLSVYGCAQGGDGRLDAVGLGGEPCGRRAFRRQRIQMERLADCQPVTVRELPESIVDRDDLRTAAGNQQRSAVLKRQQPLTRLVAPPLRVNDDALPLFQRFQRQFHPTGRDIVPVNGITLRNRIESARKPVRLVIVLRHQRMNQLLVIQHHQDDRVHQAHMPADEDGRTFDDRLRPAYLRPLHRMHHQPC